MNKTLKRLLILAAILISIGILYIINVLAASYTRDVQATVINYHTWGYANPAFVARIDKAGESGYAGGEVLGGVCQNHDVKPGENGTVIYARPDSNGVIKHEVTDPVAKLHIGHHITKWKETGNIEWLEILAICKAYGSHSNGTSTWTHAGHHRLEKVEMPEAGGAVEFSSNHKSNDVKLEKNGDPKGTGAGTYSVGPFYIKVSGETISCSYQNDYEKTWKIDIGGVTECSIGKSRTGVAINSLEPGEHEVYFRFYANSRPTSGKAEIFFDSDVVSYKVWYTDWTANNGQNVRTYDAEKEEGKKGSLELPFKDSKEEEIPIGNSLVKKDSKTGKLIKNAKFDIKISGDITNATPSGAESGVIDIQWGSNWKAVSSTKTSSSYTSSYETETWTQIGYQEGTITIKETSAPTGYKKIEGEITLTVKRYGKRTLTQSRSRSWITSGYRDDDYWWDENGVKHR